MTPPGPVATPQARDGARFAITVLTAMNLLNYVDRYVPSAVKIDVQRDLGLSDFESSVPMMAFVLVYMCASPLFGSLADRWPRKVVIAGGVALWSLATGAAAFSTGFLTFVAARAMVGVGEAAYATLAPAVLSDFYPPEKRNRVLTLFYVAIPVGTAIGFKVGGAVGEAWGWRTAFLVCGLPGLALAALVLRMRDPGRGSFDADAAAPPTPWRQALRDLAGNRTYVIAVAGYVAVTFGSGVLGEWYAPFLQRCRGMGPDEAGGRAGIVLVAGGLIGTAFGGWLGERFARRARNPYLLMSGITMAGGAVLLVPAILVRDPLIATLCGAASQILFWSYNGPLNAILVNCVPSAVRARAFALSIFMIHAFGDAVSPVITGWVSDESGDLEGAMLLAPVVALAGAAVWFAGWMRLPAGAERGPASPPPAGHPGDHPVEVPEQHQPQ